MPGTKFDPDEEFTVLDASQRHVCPGAHSMQGESIFNEKGVYIMDAPALDRNRPFGTIMSTGTGLSDCPRARYTQDYIYFDSRERFVGVQSGLSRKKRQDLIAAQRTPKAVAVDKVMDENQQLRAELAELRAERDNKMLAEIAEEEPRHGGITWGSPPVEAPQPAATEPEAVKASELMAEDNRAIPPMDIWEMPWATLRNWVTSVPGNPFADMRYKVKKAEIMAWLVEQGYEVEAPEAPLAAEA